MAVSRTLGTNQGAWLGSVLEQHCASVQIEHEHGALAAVHTVLQNQHNRLGVSEVGGVTLSAPTQLEIDTDGNISFQVELCWSEPFEGLGVAKLHRKLGERSGWSVELSNLQLRDGNSSWMTEVAHAAITTDERVLAGLIRTVTDYNHLEQLDTPPIHEYEIVDSKPHMTSEECMVWELELEWRHPACNVIRGTTHLGVQMHQGVWCFVVMSQEAIRCSNEEEMAHLTGCEAALSAIEKCLAASDHLGLQTRTVASPKICGLTDVSMELGIREEHLHSQDSFAFYQSCVQLWWGSKAASGQAVLHLCFTHGEWRAELKTVEV